MKDLVSPKQVARAIGVSESSLKRWCDQGLIPMTRTPGGHRKLPISGVLGFLKEQGHQLVEPELLGLPPTTTGAGERTLARGRAELVEAFLEGAEELSLQIVMDLYLARHSICTICDEVLAAAFHEIGDRWQCGAAEVYQERRGCEICLRILHELEQALPSVGNVAPLAIGGTTESDPYHLATTMAELVLRENGWRATSLGNMLPTATILQAMEDIRPRLVWISVSHVADEPALIRATAELHAAATQLGAALAVGGRAINSELRRRMHFSACCDTMQHLVSFAESLNAATAAS
jgi:MerR family transcriptional regulator, light-induced transcriptional regulator